MLSAFPEHRAGESLRSFLLPFSSLSLLPSPLSSPTKHRTHTSRRKNKRERRAEARERPRSSGAQSGHFPYDQIRYAGSMFHHSLSHQRALFQSILEQGRVYKLIIPPTIYQCSWDRYIYKQYLGGETLLNPTLQVRKPRHREVK